MSQYNRRLIQANRIILIVYAVLGLFMAVQINILKSDLAKQELLHRDLSYYVHESLQHQVDEVRHFVLGNGSPDGE